MESNENCPAGKLFSMNMNIINDSNDLENFTEGTGAVFKQNGFNTKTKEEQKIEDHALLNADEDDEMVSLK